MPDYNKTMIYKIMRQTTHSAICTGYLNTQKYCQSNASTADCDAKGASADARAPAPRDIAAPLPLPLPLPLHYYCVP